jgi:hypothetical protein
MKLIPLTNNNFAIVDDNDYNFLIKYKWHSYQDPLSKIWYAKRSFHGKTIRMHNQIMNAKNIDHKNHNGLDNRKDNLRKCTRSQNKKNNHGYKNNTSGFKGVYLDKNVTTQHKWRAIIRVNNKNISLGYYDTPEKASEIFNNKSKEIYGEFHNGQMDCHSTSFI